MRRWDSAAREGSPASFKNCSMIGHGCQTYVTIGVLSLFAMLRFLRVQHLAIIDTLEVEFDPGLNVLTGETGAGKSILVEAVGLLLGGRASGELVRTGEESAAVEAIFEIRPTSTDGSPVSIPPEDSALAAEFPDEEVLIRREITSQGRSRAFINGSLATAGALRDLSARLLELHGQHEHQTLLDPETHLALIDTFGSLSPAVAQTEAAYQLMLELRHDLAEVRSSSALRAARLETLRPQLAELERVSPKAGEDEELASLRRVLSSAERVERLCAESYTSLYEHDSAILPTLGAVWRRVAELATVDARFQPYLEARDDIKSQLEDLALFLRRYADGIEASPAKLQQTEERLAQIERLKRKHGPSLAEVLSRREAIAHEVAALEAADENGGELEERYRAAGGAFLAAAERLSLERKRVAAQFAREVEHLLADLAMAGTRVEFRFGEALPEPSWTAKGIDRAELFVSPNVGEELRPLARTVSGGELSRLMLAIKVLTFHTRIERPEPDIAEGGRATQRTSHNSQSTKGAGTAVPAGTREGRSNESATSAPSQLDRVRRGTGAPGMIFDEVDAGIGGRVADVVGRKLQALGSAFQVLCITHLPQIAAYADAQFLIEKRVEGTRTRTVATKLGEAGRVAELSRMLGGEAVTDAVRRSAREMLAARAGRSSRESVVSTGAAGKTGGSGGNRQQGESERRKRKVDGRGVQKVPD